VSIGEFCNREVIITDSGTGIEEAARLMREHHVGDLIVVESTEVGNVPIGILTDRDLVIEVLAQGVDPSTVAVDDLMSRDPFVMAESADLFEALEQMRSKGVRRLPVVDAHGALVGVLTLDDLIEVVGEAIEDFVKIVKAELRRETRLHR
jgi:CBS domain-containing protein